MRRAAGWTLIALAIFLGAPGADALTLTVEVLEFRFTPQYNTARPESVTAEVDRSTVLELRPTPSGEYAADVASTAQRLMIRIRTRDPLIARTVIARVPDSARRGSLRLRVHVIERQDVNYNYTRRAVTYLRSGEHDIFLALAEYAVSQVGQVDSQLRVRAEYHLALALLETCRTLHYDTCDLGATRFRQLIAMYPGREQYFEPDNLTPVNMKATLDALLRPGPGSSSVLHWLAEGAIDRRRRLT